MTPFLRSVLCVAALGISASALPAQAQQKSGEALIGYVNLQRAILETNEGKRAATTLKSTIEQKQKLLTGKQKELEDMEKAAGGKADAETKKAMTEKLIALRGTFVKEQQDLQDLERKEMGSLVKKMKDVIKVIGERDGYTLILDGQEARLLFAKNHLDLTNQVIRDYNLKHK